MSGTDDYYMWAVEKYGYDDYGDPVVHSFDLAWEFFSDHLDETVQRLGQSLKYDVFLSYAWVDKTEPTGLVRLLADEGLRVWFDRDVVGETDEAFLVYRHLHEGIAQSRCGVAYVTPQFLEREWTLHEVRGMARHGRLRALIFDGVDENSKSPLVDWADGAIPVLSRAEMTLEQVAGSLIKRI